MNRNRLLGLFLFIAIIIPQPSQAQLGGYYHMISVYIDYTYVVREMTDVEDPGNGYAVTASWPSVESAVYTHELLSFDVGDTIAVVPVPLIYPALLQAYGVDLYLNLSDEGDMFISGTYPTIDVEDCSTAISIPPVEDPATYQLGGEPVVDEVAGTATWGFGIVTSGIFANQMYAPDLHVDEEGVNFGIGTDHTCWGMITAQYDANFERIESAEVYWEAQDGVETTLGIDTEGNLNRVFGVTGAFGDHTTIPYLATLNPAINVGTYPMIGGPGADVNGDGTIDGDDGFIPNPELEWGYIFDPNGGDGVPFNGDEPLQFTGYYFTGNFLAAAGALATTFGQFSDPAILLDTDGDGVPDTHPWIVYYMQLGYDQVAALVATADSLADLGMQGLATTTFGLPAANAAALGAAVGAYAGTTLTALLTAGVGTVSAITQTAQATGAYAVGALASAGVQVDDSGHDYEPAGMTMYADLVSPGFEDGAEDSTNVVPLGWDEGQSGGHISTVMDSDLHSGDYAVELGVEAGNGYAVIFQDHPTAGGTQWTVSSWIRDVSDADPGGDFAALKMEALDADGNNVTTIETIQTGVTSDWAQFSATFTVAPTAVTARVVLVATRWDGGAQCAYQFDDVEMSRASSGNGRLVFQVGNNCIPDFSTQRVNPVFANTGGVGVESEESMIPKEFALYDNFPNPFNPTTQIAIDLPEDAYTELTVWNIMGQQVTTVYSGNLNAGRHNVTFNGRDMTGNMLSSGMYIYRVTAGKYNATKKMTLMK
jgi:hypothetical protein